MPQIRHRYVFPSTAARDAFVYSAAIDLNQWVEVLGSPPVTYQIAAVTPAGVATFAQLGGGGAPAAHAASHENGGSDEINVAGLSGLLADGQTPLAHAASHKSGGSDAIKLDALAAPTDVATLNASTSAHGLMPKASGSTTTFYRSDGTQATPGGVSGVPMWFPAAPPVSPSAQDDEFDSGSSVLNVKWSKWDVPGILTATNDTTKNMGKLVSTSNGTVRMTGIYQAVPGSEFAVYARIAFNYDGASGQGAIAALMIAGDLAGAPSTAGFHTIELDRVANSVFVRARTWTSYTTATTRATYSQMDACYFRIRANGTTVAMDFSVDGVGWTQIDTRTAAFTPANIGIALYNGDSGVSLTAYVDFFRVFAGAGSSAIGATEIGRYL